MEMPIEPSLQAIETELPSIQGKNYWPRAVAYAIDLAIMNGLSFLAGLSAGNVLGLILYLFVLSIGRNYHIVDAGSSNIDKYLIGILQSIFYFWIFEWLFGRTFGKLVLKMRVISSNGEIPSRKQAFKRSVYRLVDGLFFGAVAAINMKKPGYQRIGDLRASTFVVSSDDDAVKKFPPWWKFWLSLFIYFLFDVMINFLWSLFYIRID